MLTWAARLQRGGRGRDADALAEGRRGYMAEDDEYAGRRGRGHAEEDEVRYAHAHARMVVPLQACCPHALTLRPSWPSLFQAAR